MIQNQNRSKECCKCHSTELTEEDFHKSKDMKRVICKECVKAYNRQKAKEKREYDAKYKFQ